MSVIPCDPSTAVRIDRALVETPRIAVHPRPDTGQYVVMLDEGIDPRDRLVGFPVEDGDTTVLVITRVVTEELGFGLGAIIACKMVVAKWDLICDTLLYVDITLAINEIDAFSGLGHDGTEAAVLDDGLDVNALLPAANVNKLNHLHSPSQWRVIRR